MQRRLGHSRALLGIGRRLHGFRHERARCKLGRLHLFNDSLTRRRLCLGRLCLGLRLGPAQTGRRQLRLGRLRSERQVGRRLFCPGCRPRGRLDRRRHGCTSFLRLRLGCLDVRCSLRLGLLNRCRQRALLIAQQRLASSGRRLLDGGVLRLRRLRPDRLHRCRHCLRLRRRGLCLCLDLGRLRR